MFKKTKVCTGVLIALGGGLTLAGLPAFAQTTDRVEITGSRIKTISAEGPSPIAVLGAADIKIDGVKNVESLLNNLPQVFADQGGNVVNGSTGTAQVNLRGLGSERTLVLVNGRRMPMGSPIQGGLPPDLNQIPAGLIKRIEVLTGGASAVYGSDAVSGVVNFIMNDRFEGVQVDANYSFFNHKQQNTAGVGDIVAGRAATNPAQFAVPGDISSDGAETNFSLLMGSNFAGDKGNATLFFNYKKTDALLQSERDFSACSLASSNAGFSCGGSSTNATGRIQDLTSGASWTNGDNNGTARAFNGALDQYNFGPLNYFQRPSERYGFNAYANYQIADAAKAYVEFSFHDDSTVAQIAPGGVFFGGGIYTVNGDNPLLSPSWRTALNLVNPTDSTTYLLGRRNVEGGGRQSEYKNSSFRSLVGVKGDVGNWNYDAYLLKAKVNYSQTDDNYFLDDRIAKALDVVNVNGVATCASVVNGTDLNCVPYNPWLTGPNGVTAAQLNYLQAPGFRKGGTGLEAFGVSLSTDLGEYGMRLPNTKNGVGLALGAEVRKESIELKTDANVQAGNLSGSGGPTAPLFGEYSVREVFGEVRIPILEGVPMADLLSVTGSYRHSSYDTDITTNTYGVGAEWAPVKSAKFRASYQQAVRAPNLQELYLAQGNNLFDMNEDPCAGPTPTATLAECQRTGVTATQYGTILDSPAGQYNFLQGGNPTLQPETANSVTFGIVLQPTRDMSVSIDYFNIKVEDTIGIVDPTTTLAQCIATGDPKFCANVQRDSLGSLWIQDNGRIVATQQNIGKTSTEGWDFGFNWNVPLSGMGALGFSAVGTLLTKLETEEIVGLGSYDCVGLYGLSKCGAPSPEWRHKIRANWTTPWDFDVAATWRYMSAVKIQESSDQPLLAGSYHEVNKNLDAQNYLDLSASWRATKGLTLSMGINNILDSDPPVVVVGTGQGNGNTFPGVYDALGRKVYLTASYKF